MATKELVIASKAVAVGDYPPGPGQSEQDGVIIRAATRAGEARRAMSRMVHDLRYRPPRQRTAKMLVLIRPTTRKRPLART